MKNTICGAKTKTGEPCESTELFPNGRCRLHGGPSSGPKSKEGRERARQNLRQSTEPPANRGSEKPTHHQPRMEVPDMITARHEEEVAKLAIISKSLRPNAPLGFQRREIMELSAELQAAVEKVAAILRQTNAKIGDLRASIRGEFRREIGVDLGAMFDDELRHWLGGGDPLPGSFAAAMRADQPKRLNLADRVAVALAMIDDMEREQRSARVRGCVVPTEYPRLVPQPTEQPDPSPLTEPDELETDEETLWS